MKTHLHVLIGKCSSKQSVIADLRVIVIDQGDVTLAPMYVSVCALAFKNEVNALTWRSCCACC